MIKESDLEKLSYPDAPKIITESVPGPKSLKQLGEAPEFESMARGAGRFPVVYDQGFGATVKDPDGNLYIDITAGVAVNSVGRLHPRVVEAIHKQTGKLMHSSDCSSSSSCVNSQGRPRRSLNVVRSNAIAHPGNENRRPRPKP